MAFRISHRALEVKTVMRGREVAQETVHVARPHVAPETHSFARPNYSETTVSASYQGHRYSSSSSDFCSVAPR